MSDSCAAVLNRLRSVVGDAHVHTRASDMAPFVSDWRRQYPGNALAVVRPGCTEEVAQVVAACAKAGVKLVPQGGNTGLVGGSTPDDSGRELVLNLGRMLAVRHVDPLDNSMTLEAGCTVLAAQEAAAHAGRLFPLSLASEGSATVGGVLSTNAGGEQVLRYGNTRDLTLGLEVVLADGRVWNGLSALRKDNTGYDLKHLFIGGEGTLGVITAATFKLFAQPRQVVTGWVALRDAGAAVRLLSRMTEAVGERVTAFELIGREALAQVLAHPGPGMRDPLPGNGASWMALFDVSETAGSIDLSAPVEQVLADAAEAGDIDDAVLATSQAQAHALWALREHIPEAQKLDGPSVKHDISVAVSRIPAFIETANAQLERLLPGIRICCFGHVGDGNLHYNQSKPRDMADADFLALEPAIHEVVYDVTTRLRGSISAEHGIGRLKQEAFLRTKPALALELMQRIKSALDPQALLNPGRMLPAQADARSR